MRGRTVALLVIVLCGVGLAGTFGPPPAPAAQPTPGTKAVLDKLDSVAGICLVLGDRRAELAIELARASELLVYVQLPDAKDVQSARRAAQAAGLLNSRVYIDRGSNARLHLADNLADVVVVCSAAEGHVAKKELLRVLRPGGKGLSGAATIVKPAPEGSDDWSHPYHGPDNNPLSTDRLARAPYLTQFVAEPKFSPMPEVSVAAGGRVFKAFGHIAHKANQNAMLNTLLCINAYNGTVLWKRKLNEGFMIHRNTMIATADALYLGDDQSCKVIDARTGKLKDQIVIPKEISDGPVWKWMAVKDGVLYALVGGGEVRVDTQRSSTPGLGHWPWGMWKGHDYKDPRTSFGFGRTFVAIDTGTKKSLWNHKEEQYVDSRGVCMHGRRIYFYSPQKSLGCLDAKAGKVLWKNSDRGLLEAIGPNGPAQHYVTGYATTTYIKCNDKFIFFAGPQRRQLVAASTEDGRLLWKKGSGNLHLVLREDGLYGAGPGATGAKLAYDSGEQLARLPTRRACTRATGSVDSIFYRTSGGTVRIDVASNTAQHIAPMRPPCQDGVIISNGLLYWGPWMCGCQLSLYGHVCLGPAGTFHDRPAADDSRLESGPGVPTSVERFEVKPGDWPAYCADNRRTSATGVAVPRRVGLKWTFKIPSAPVPTAPVVAGGVTFVADRNGVVRALDSNGKLRWEACTGGAVYFPPALSQGRLFAGSADGRVYAFEAASGRQLWSFRVAPVQRRIPVYGKLISTWPVAGGVVVDKGVVYAAAGIAHYDGTHVVALDALTGGPKWHNGTSGTLSKQVNSGISLQGNLYLGEGELRFTGGGIYETARYDLQTGKCLNQPKQTVTSQFHTAFYPYYPAYGKYMSLDHTLADGRSLSCDASYEGSYVSNLALLEPLPPGAPKVRKPVSRWGWRGPKRKAVWQDKSGRRFTGFVVTPEVLLAAGHPSGNPQAPFLVAINVQDGSNVWQKDLPALVVKGGVAVDHQGRIVACLENGQVLCFGSKQSP